MNKDKITTHELAKTNPFDFHCKSNCEECKKEKIKDLTFRKTETKTYNLKKVNLFK